MRLESIAFADTSCWPLQLEYPREPLLVGKTVALVAALETGSLLVRYLAGPWAAHYKPAGRTHIADSAVDSGVAVAAR